MKVVCLLGSPRTEGNSATLARQFLATAAELGAQTRAFELNRLAYRGCQGCYACKTGMERCVLQDDLTEVLEEVRGADIVVLATPVYYGDVSAQMKGFIDRTFSFLEPDYNTNPNPSRLAPGKRLVFIVTQGHPDEERFADVFPRYDAFLQWYGFGEGILIRACGLPAKTPAEMPDEFLKRAAEEAKLLLSPPLPEKEPT